MHRSSRARTPWHLWVVGVLSLLWNAYGAFDYVMTNIRDRAYLARFPPEMMQVLDSFPGWAIAAWACGVWGAVAGSVLLLLRSRFAAHAFALSLAGLAASTVYQMGIEMPGPLKGPEMVAMQVAIWAAAILFLLYAIRQRRARVLR